MIHVSDFSSIQEMGEYLQALSKNRTLLVERGEHGRSTIVCTDCPSWWIAMQTIATCARFAIACVGGLVSGYDTTAYSIRTNTIVVVVVVNRNYRSCCQILAEGTHKSRASSYLELQVRRSLAINSKKECSPPSSHSFRHLIPLEAERRRCCKHLPFW